MDGERFSHEGDGTSIARDFPHAAGFRTVSEGYFWRVDQPHLAVRERSNEKADDEASGARARGAEGRAHEAAHGDRRAARPRRHARTGARAARVRFARVVLRTG